MGNLLQRSGWLRASIGALLCTIGFMVFFSAVPSAFMNWSNGWDWVEAPTTFGVIGLGKRIRDVFVVAYYGAITPLTFIAFSLYQKMNPLNADADEGKRDAGGYR